ncbi:hypothetical protein FLONG3_1343 [Fusarium longipes]|uniref:Uncharacterized protein n=1 Tax=Fusarium longipes TaxID=694270 RepID=A0A395T7W0_9HYPO|nr:hypothetical protein FLONG3_1343 [Fusarium longipes]
MGPYVQPTITFHFVVRHLSKSHSFAQMIVPLQHLLTTPHIVDVPARDETSLLPLLGHQAMNLEGLDRSTTNQDPFPSINSDNEGRPALDIAQVTETIRTIRLDVSSENVIISRTASFEQERGSHPNSLVAIVDAVVSRLQLPEKSSIRAWLYPENTFSETW